MQKAIQPPLSVPEQQPVVLKQGEQGFVQKVLHLKVGVIPLPLYVVFALIIFAASVLGELPNDMIGGFAVIIVLGVLLSDLGFKLPILKISAVPRSSR